MDKKKWKRLIKKQCESIGTYKKEFDSVIDTLADILEIRDNTLEEYRASGQGPLVEHVQDRGARNLKKNPALQIIQDLNTQALAYWKELGLTAAGLKKINGELTIKTSTGLEDILEQIAAK